MSRVDDRLDDPTYVSLHHTMLAKVKRCRLWREQNNGLTARVAVLEGKEDERVAEQNRIAEERRIAEQKRIAEEMRIADQQ